MTAKEIIQLENGNLTRIFLLREGIFWKAYEKSAFAFFNQIHPYKPVRKWLQVLRGDLVSLGFPMASEDVVLKDVNVLLREDDRIVLSALPVVPDQFTEWKESVPLVVHKSENVPLVRTVSSLNKNAFTSQSCSYEGMADSIRRFNIANKTPVDCMLFLMELKRGLSAEY